MADQQIIDVTPPIKPSLCVWPGDTPQSREVLMDMQRGDNLTLSTLRATVHLGAHADGPNHYGRNAPSIDQRSLEYYLGPCRVVRVHVGLASRVTVGDVQKALAAGSSESEAGTRHAGAALRHGTPPGAIGVARVLIATDTYPDPCQWNGDFAGLDPALVDWLHAEGVITVGIDTPSVDLFDSKDLPAHNAFLRNDMAILEGLVLKDVPEGLYELIALPLPLVGFDASPVRAILRR